MREKIYLTIIFFIVSGVAKGLYAQNTSTTFIRTEAMLGLSAPSNDFYPAKGLQKQLLLGFGKNHNKNKQEWAHWLTQPKTGILAGFTDFGNLDSLGIALTVMPYVEFKALKNNKISGLVGLGASYFNKKYDPETNSNNQGISTNLTWSFRSFLYYKFLETEKINYKVGLGYFHHSNGHTKLPNNGINSLLASVVVDFNNNKLNLANDTILSKTNFKQSTYNNLTVRGGYGFHIFADAFNYNKDVYSFSLEYSKIYQKTYRIGIGAYYRYYEHYYNYLTNNESLVQEGREFNNLTQNPFWNASNIGVMGSFEFLLNHFGIEVQVGANLHKPAYKIDWRINQGWDNTPRVIPEDWILGEFDTKYNLKQIIYSRMGLKYYVLGTNEVPKHNLYLAAHINSNLGQADFTEFSLGYVYSFNFKEKN